MAIVAVSVLSLVIIAVGAWWVVERQERAHAEIRHEYRMATAAMSDELRRAGEREVAAHEQAMQLVMRANEQTEFQTRALSDTIQSAVRATVEAITVNQHGATQADVSQVDNEKSQQSGGWSMTDTVPEDALDWTAGLIPDEPYEMDRGTVPIIRPGESPIPGVSFPDLTGEGL